MASITGQREVNSSFEKWIEKEINKAHKAIIHKLSYVGNRCVNIARGNGSYIDQTGNLRSSIGYVLVEDGRIIKSYGFQTANSGEVGAVKGRSFAENLASQYPNGIILIIVAGMNYATYVANKGLDVLDSAELLADKLILKMLKKVGFK